MSVLLFCISFFFSSRRRHTRYIGDWSSNVCSSDLCWPPWRLRQRARVKRLLDVTGVLGEGGPAPHRAGLEPDRPRSEERRVGKECRSRGAWEDGRGHKEEGMYKEEQYDHRGAQR